MSFLIPCSNAYVLYNPYVFSNPYVFPTAYVLNIILLQQGVIIIQFEIQTMKSY